MLGVNVDKNNKGVDTERLCIKVFKSFTIDSLRTLSYGVERTFLESIISSI